MHHRPRRLAALLAAHLLLSACSATAQPPRPGAGGIWADPKPQPLPTSQPFPGREPVVHVRPNFQAPSATHCARPVTTREVPGRTQEQQAHRDREESSLSRRFAAPGAGALAAESAAPSVADAAKEKREKSAAPAARSAPMPPAPADTAYGSSAFAPQPAQRPPVPVNTQPVTAGVVDDNADFGAYLSFRSRTRVQHLARDVRERHLLQVRDRYGRSMADAEVAVQSPNGQAMWARTDTAGRAWLHPNAFDPSRAANYYEVLVRKDGQYGNAILQRGQKSAVEVVVDAAAAQPRARLDLVFLIDATGSMADEIDKLKATLTTITGELAALPSRPDLCLGLVAYRDKGDAFLTRSHDFTNDVDGFLRGALGPLRAGGGGDYPEAMSEALHETVHNLSWRGDGATRLVVLLADAPPHLDYGGPAYDQDMMAALGKGIKIFGVGASGLDKQGEFIQRQIAQYTGGRFVFLTYADARRPSSGPGRETVHDVKDYSVDTLDRLIVRLVSEELGKLGT